MKCRKFYLLVFVLIMVSLIAACGGAPPPGSAVDPSSATQLANAEAEPTDTPTLAPTDIPIPTDTPTPLPTPTDTPTTTPTPTLPELFGQENFEEISSLVPPGTKFGDASVNDSAAFRKESSGEFVTWFTMSLASDLELAGFRLELQEPNLLINLLVEAIGAVGTEGRESLSGLEGIGDEANGVAVATKLNDLTMRMDVIIFQRGNVGAVVAVVYVDGLQPSVPAQDIAIRLDEKIRSR